jgi:hypothetical protein
MPLKGAAAFCGHADYRAALDPALHFARKCRVDFVGPSSIEPDWLRGLFCTRRQWVCVLAAKDTMASAETCAASFP